MGKSYKSRSRRKGTGPKRLRNELEDEVGPVIASGGVIDMEVINREELANEYIRALSQIRQTQETNHQQEYINSRHKILFYGLIFLGLFATYKLFAVPGITNQDQLNSIKNQKAMELLKEGMDLDKVNIDVPRFLKDISKTRFKFGDGTLYTADEILEFLKTIDMLKPIVETLENVYNSYVNSTNKMAEISKFLFNTLWGSLKLELSSIVSLTGLINMNIMIFNTMKPYIKGFFSVYKDVQDIRGVIKDAFYPQDKIEQDTGEVVKVNINNKIKIVKLSEVMRTINTKEPTLVLTWYESFLAALFAHEEAWTVDDSSMSSSSSIHTNLSNKTVDSLNEINEIGYGDEFDRITELIKDNFTGNINSAIEYAALGLSSVYTSLLIMNSDVLNQKGGNSPKSEISDLSPNSVNYSVKSISADSIKSMTIHALLKTIRTSKVLTTSQKNNLIHKIMPNFGRKKITSKKQKRSNSKKTQRTI